MNTNMIRAPLQITLKEPTGNKISGVFSSEIHDRDKIRGVFSYLNMIALLSDALFQST